MKRLFFGSVILLLSIRPVNAQRFPAEVSKLVDIVNEVMAYTKGLDGHTQDSNIVWIRGRLLQFDSISQPVYNEGYLTDQKVCLYYRTVFEIRLAYLLSEMQRYHEAYIYYADVKVNLGYLLQPGWFPVEYSFHGEGHTINRTFLDGAIAVCYTDMGWVAANDGQWEDAMKYSSLAFDAAKITKGGQYRALASKLIVKIGKKEFDTEMLDFLLRSVSLHYHMDSVDKKETVFDDMKMMRLATEVSDSIASKSNPAAAYMLIGAAFDDMENYNEAGKYFNKALKYFDRLSTMPEGVFDDHLHRAINTAVYIKDIPLAKWALGILKEYRYFDTDRLDIAAARRVYVLLGDNAGVSRMDRLERKRIKR